MAVATSLHYTEEYPSCKTMGLKRSESTSKTRVEQNCTLIFSSRFELMYIQSLTGYSAGIYQYSPGPISNVIYTFHKNKNRTPAYYPGSAKIECVKSK